MKKVSLKANNINQKNIVDDPNLVLGMFKEVQFYSLPVFSLINNQEVKFFLKKNTIESALTLTFVDKNKNYNYKIYKNLKEFYCWFPQFKVFWEAKVIHISKTNIVLETPKIIFIENLRSNMRSKVNFFDSNDPNILIQTHNFHGSGCLVINNVSKDGVGGRIIMSRKMPIRIGSGIRGVVDSDYGAININGKIVRIKLFSGKPEIVFNDEHVCYDVGIVNKLQAKKSTNLNLNQRSYERVDVLFELIANSVLNNKVKINLKVFNASVSGFAAQVTDAHLTDHFPVGAVVSLENYCLKLRVIDISQDKIRFQILVASSDERLAWLKLISKFKDRHIQAKSNCGFDLISLFCESGAIATDFIKEQSSYFNGLTNKFIEENSNDLWIHRWIEGSDDRKIKGHICAVKMADNLWHLGEIAGGKKNRKISKNFVPNFFNMMKEYALSCSPCPQFIIYWTINHGYWKEFDSFLSKTKNEYLLFSVIANYYRFGEIFIQKLTSDSNMKIIAASDYELITYINLCLIKNNLIKIAEALDFSINHFGSPGLKEIILRSKKRFYREYFFLTHKSCEFLIISSLFPKNSSINRSLDATWILPLGKYKISKEQFESICSLIQKHNMELGRTISGVIIPDCLNVKYEPTKTLKMYIGHPLLLEWFSEQQ